MGIEAVSKALRTIIDAPPVLGRDVKPNWACAIGFFTGGIGLAIYFRTFIDLIILLALAIAADLIAIKFVSAELGLLAGAIIASLYRYFRALNSNQRRAGSVEGVPAACVGAT